MTQYDEEVERHRIREKAVKWASRPTAVHTHSLGSMYYDDRPEDTLNGKSVTDMEFANGIIKRYQNGELIHIFGKEMTEDELIDEFLRK
jgi:hypothetical protein